MAFNFLERFGFTPDTNELIQNGETNEYLALLLREEDEKGVGCVRLRSLVWGELADTVCANEAEIVPLHGVLALEVVPKPQLMLFGRDTSELKVGARLLSRVTGREFVFRE